MINGLIEKKDHFDEGGEVCSVVNGIVNEGRICTGPLSEASYYELGLEFYRIAVGRILGLYKGVKSTNPNLPLMPLTPQDLDNTATLSGSKKNAYEQFKTVYKSTVELLVSRGFSQSIIPKEKDLFEFIFNHYQADTFSEELGGTFMKQLAEKECSGRMKEMSQIYCEDISLNNDLGIISEIDQQLERGSPAGISYCSSILKNKSYLGRISFQQDSKKSFWKTQTECGKHASVVIGRKTDHSGKCHYLIRNSWGKNAKYAWETSDGDVWVEEKALRKNITDVHIIN
jgi:hypothetical protein